MGGRELIAQAWVCLDCKTRSIGEGPLKCWICGEDMEQATQQTWDDSRGSWINPRGEDILSGVDLLPLEWIWICPKCKTRVVSTTRPQCWPCREYMRNMTLKELSVCE